MNVQSVRIWAPRGGGTAAGGTRKTYGFPLVSNDSGLNLQLSCAGGAEGARVVGSGGLQSVRITEMLCFTPFPIDF